MACSAYRSTVHSYAAPLWLLPLCLSDMGQSQGNVPEKQPTSGSYHRSFIKRHLHNGKEPKREAKGRDDLTKIALPSVRYAPEWQQLLLKARLELCIPLTAPCPATSQVSRASSTAAFKAATPQAFHHAHTRHQSACAWRVSQHNGLFAMIYPPKM